ncbi:ankyrin repeat domain-containing protein [Candidatus Sodalis pierantonius]|uniref:ankyrin repeat domain-containing protein n=1 Tax=Candidatus Sodalis pierantonii TaxID=1486991 RepID=UPI00046CBE3C|nr:ankyrin repeat domain-containing protein [Candidatus Sodalis pierantonius]
MTVQILLNHNDIDINRVDQLGFTPLMRAAQGNHHAAISELLTHPAIAINLRNINGMSALSLAVERGHTEAVQQLLSVAGVTIQQRDNAGRTSLTLAQHGRHPRMRRCSNDTPLTRRRPGDFGQPRGTLLPTPAAEALRAMPPPSARGPRPLQSVGAR